MQAMLWEDLQGMLELHKANSNPNKSGMAIQKVLEVIDDLNGRYDLVVAVSDPNAEKWARVLKEQQQRTEEQERYENFWNTL
ncbi:hypothetical protein [Helicobacter sp. NHP22-001]|uniref:hypothetical protein n=1 Tax=Helicobacter sp. NHP22-001 TaxID=3040202 RepID=UPI00244D8D3E|nr:hypothetical protein [Helicobacter sp. NHP22-001]GMB95975.1 hypothetical protein NHP22001_05640 [Helicobacter sp. NHP22-001]